MEILQAMEPAAVFVCVGGGGLITGIALAIKLQCPHVKIIGVEPLLKIQGTLSLQRRKLIEGEASTTIADAVRIPSLGKLTFPAMMRYVDEMINVSEEQIAEATQLTASSSHLLVEPSGALALAGALAYRGAIAPGKPVVCIASGGNTTIAALNELANRKKRQ
jgi:threonine dehydratase